MLPNKAETYRQDNIDQPLVKGADRSLQLTLWTLWTLAVIGTAFWNWRLDVTAGQPVNMLGMVIYSGLTGLIGFLVITLAELWLEPDRFLN